MNSNELLKKLWKIKARGADEIPKGYKDLEELNKDWKVHRTTAGKWVAELVKAGELKQIKLRFFDGRRIQMRYYYGK
jgi:predicted transcriptional regulator